MEHNAIKACWGSHFHVPTLETMCTLVDGEFINWSLGSSKFNGKIVFLFFFNDPSRRWEKSDEDPDLKWKRLTLFNAITLYLKVAKKVVVSMKSNIIIIVTWMSSLLTFFSLSLNYSF